MTFEKTRRILVCLLVMSILAIVVVFAQQENQPPPPPQRPGPGGGFNPEQMQARMLERSTTNLKLTAEETKVIMPKIQAIISYRTSMMQELQPLRTDLQDLMSSGKASDKAIKQQLDKIKTKAAEIKKKTDAMENDLKAVLTVQQEAQLTLNGVITNGMAMGFGGGRGPGFGGGRGPGAGGGGRGGNFNRPGQNN